jgi:hypothetical protein
LTVFNGSSATDLQIVVLWFEFIFCLLVISGFAGFLPVILCFLLQVIDNQHYSLFRYAGIFV